MIAVVGRINAGAAVPIARRAVRAGAPAELIATAPHGSAGDALLAELTKAGVGHAAVLRSSAPALEPADLELALRYVPDVRVVVVAEDEPGLWGAAGDAAAWSGASLILAAGDAAAWSGASLILISGSHAAAGPGDPSNAERSAATDAIVLAGPPRDPDEAFAGLVASLAARLDRGEHPDAAWRGVSAGLGVERISPAARS